MSHGPIPPSGTRPNQNRSRYMMRSFVMELTRGKPARAPWGLLRRAPARAIGWSHCPPTAVSSTSWLDSLHPVRGSVAARGAEPARPPSGFAPRSRVRGIRRRSPPASVDPLDLQGGEVNAVEAAHVHVVPLRVRPGPVEAGDAAVAAEVMTCRLGPELVGRHVVGAGKQAEAVRGNLVMEVPQAGADGAVALARPREVRRDLEANTPAVAAARVGCHLSFSFTGRLWTQRQLRTASSLQVCQRVEKDTELVPVRYDGLAVPRPGHEFEHRAGWLDVEPLHLARAMGEGTETHAPHRVPLRHREE